MNRASLHPGQRPRRSLAGGTERGGGWACFLLLLAGLLLPSLLQAAPRAYIVAEESLKDRTRWEVVLASQGAKTEIKIVGNHDRGDDCVQRPLLKVKYNQQKARIKTRQMERIRCHKTEQTTTLELKRRAVELFVNGDLVAFLDVQGTSAGPESGPPSSPLVLPASPQQPGEPIFAVVPAVAQQAGCHTISKVTSKKKGTVFSVDYLLGPDKQCAEERSAYQLLVPLGPQPRGSYSIYAPGMSKDFAVGEELEMTFTIDQTEEGAAGEGAATGVGATAGGAAAAAAAGVVAASGKPEGAASGKGEGEAVSDGAGAGKGEVETQPIPAKPLITVPIDVY